MTDSNNTISCLYNLMVSDTFNRQIIKQGAISANIENYSMQVYTLAPQSTLNLSISNFLFLKSDNPVVVSGQASANVNGLFIVQTSGNVVITNNNSEAVSLEIVVC